MLLAITFSTIGDVATLFAVGAALATVYFARITVAEARKARREARAEHVEETEQQVRLLEATRTAHREEMAERERALEAELVLQRLGQLGKITDVLREVADVAREEMVEAPPKPDGVLFALTRIPTALIQLAATMNVFERLGGPSLEQARELARSGYHPATPPVQVLGQAVSALGEIEHLSREHQELALPDIATKLSTGSA